jgi:hypothetical protein
MEKSFGSNGLFNIAIVNSVQPFARFWKNFVPTPPGGTTVSQGRKKVPLCSVGDPASADDYQIFARY